MKNNTILCLLLHLGILVAASLMAQETETDVLFDDEEEIVELGVFEVTARRGDSHRPETVLSATRFESLARDLPIMVDIITKDMFNEFMIEDMTEALTTLLPGINTAGAPRLAVIRGMLSDYALRNGIPVTNIFKTFPIERIEVVRGAAGVLYGVTQPGGVRNMISMRPTSKPSYRARALINTFGAQSYHLTARGPLIPGGKLSYRLAVAYGKHAKTHDQRWRTDRFIYPAIQWRPTKTTIIFVECDYQSYEANASGGFPNLRMPGENFNRPATPNNLGYDLGYNFSVSGPSPSQRQLVRLTNIIIDQKIGSNWSFRGMYSWQLYNQEANQYNQNGYMTPGARTYNLVARAISNRFRQEFARTDLLGKFSGKSFVNRILIGGDYTWRLSSDNKIWNDAYQNASGRWITRVNTVSVDDYHNPTYGNGLLYDYSNFREINPLVSHNRAWDTLVGAYVVNQFSFNRGRTHLLAGARHDWLKSEAHSPVLNYTPQNTAKEVTKSNRTSPQIGISQRISSTISSYANYSTSVYPNTKKNPDGSTLEAQYGKGIEAGLKMVAKKIEITAGWFLIYARNLPIEDPRADIDPDYKGFYVVAGKARSHGADFAFKYNPTRNIRLTGAYTYVSARDYDTGLPLVRSTKHSANASASYSFRKSIFKGLSLGAMYRYRSKIYIGNTGREWDPSISLVDLRASYPLRIKKHRISLQVVVKNLLDKKNIHDGPNGHPYNAGRGATFAVEYRY